MKISLLLIFSKTSTVEANIPRPEGAPYNDDDYQGIHREVTIPILLGDQFNAIKVFDISHFSEAAAVAVTIQSIEYLDRRQRRCTYAIGVTGGLIGAAGLIPSFGKFEPQVGEIPV